MGGTMAGLVVVFVAIALALAYVWLLRSEYAQARSRTDRHARAGGTPGSAPDWIPGHTT